MTELDPVRSRLLANLDAVNQRIADAARRSGREAADITLVAVSKYVDADVTRSLIHCGQNVLGESRPQSLWDKAEQLVDEPVRWHLIGHLQRNKVKRTIPLCTLIHSIDSLRLLKSVDSNAAEMDDPVDCLLEINVSEEQAKHGFAASELESALSTAAELKSININGLMAMASQSGDADRNRREFAQLRQLRDRHQRQFSGNIELAELSMGMSGDFESAIEEGATIVRIGSVLFEGIVD